ncbi:MAG: dipeptidase PepV [Peptostreptococcaceae bacterium]|nr:dipeptidase PepV [Peptostreptococcaceae bacterium]
MTYLDHVEANKEEMIETLAEVIRMKSVLNDPVYLPEGEVYPFGEDVQNVYKRTLDIGEEFGFETTNIDNYGGHIEFKGEDAKETFAIIGHLDVVPEGSDWEHAPYGAEIVDNWMYGRGTTDDKGPVIACLYAMKALKQANIVPKKNIRLILGLDEETGWKGMDYYLSKTKAPDFGITPDGEFPAINGEKGIIYFSFARKFSENKNSKGLELTSIKAGNAPNMVPDFARAVIKCEDRDAYDNIKELGSLYRKESNYKINFKGIGKSLEITTHGVSAHGASPESGLNAISIMMKFLGKLNFAFEETNDFVCFYNKNIGFEVDGKSLGINLYDEASGPLTVNVGMMEMTNKAVQLVVNARYPVSFTEEDIYSGLNILLKKEKIGLIKEKLQKPIYKEPDDPMIKTLMDVYQNHTGDIDSKPLVIGGGTYARATKNIVAFGGAFPDDEDRMHQKNERINLDKFVLMTKIYAEAIYKLTCI